MRAAVVLAALRYALGNQCVRISYATDENGAKTVSKSFAITARSPEACKKNQFSGLGPTKAFALEVSILEVLKEKRNASSYTTRKCRDRYFPRLLERNDPKRAFVQSYDGEPLTDGQHHNQKLCQLSLDAVGSSTSTSRRCSASRARGSSSTGASWTASPTPTCSRSSTARSAPRTRARRRGPRRRGRAGTAP